MSEHEKLKLAVKALWSYCLTCWERTDFVWQDDRWVCSSCGKPMGGAK